MTDGWCVFCGTVTLTACSTITSFKLICHFFLSLFSFFQLWDEREKKKKDEEDTLQKMLIVLRIKSLQKKLFMTCFLQFAHDYLIILFAQKKTQSRREEIKIVEWMLLHCVRLDSLRYFFFQSTFLIFFISPLAHTMIALKSD